MAVGAPSSHRPAPFALTLILWRWGWAAVLIPTSFLIAHFTLGGLFTLIPFLAEMPFDWRQPQDMGHHISLSLYMLLALTLVFLTLPRRV